LLDVNESSRTGRHGRTAAATSQAERARSAGRLVGGHPGSGRPDKGGQLAGTSALPLSDSVENRRGMSHTGANTSFREERPMLDIRKIRDDADAVRTGIKAKNVDPAVVDVVLDLDRRRRETLTGVESLKSERNRVSKQIGERRKRGENTEADQAEVRAMGDRIASLDETVRVVDAELQNLLLTIPNIPHSTTPVGADSSDNKVVRVHGRPRKFDFEPRTHVELGEKLGIMDLARSARMSGSGFPLFIGAGSRLERGLIQYMLDVHVADHGYTEMWPSALCNTAAMTGTGQLPKLAEDMYRLAADELYLIPTAEVPVTNYFREEIIDRPLPVYFTAYTPCFRREAGSAGKETRGILRVHQFDKVEMVKFVEPETSYDELESLVVNAEDILQRLGLHYRVVSLCSGDLSFAAAKCYDIELWAPGQKAWLEVSSCSNFEDFQARRAGIRWRDSQGKVRFVHTLNGSGVALPRLVVALLENGQMSDGSVELPGVLAPYMGGKTRITPEGLAV
jgi:seryl-tRNA synthetase